MVCGVFVCLWCLWVCVWVLCGVCGVWVFLLYLLSCSITLYLVIVHAIYIEFTVVILSSWVVTSVCNANSCVCMLVVLLIVLSLECVKFFYFVRRFREFFEYIVVFFDKHIFFNGSAVCLRYCCYWAFSSFS